jgi:hypothetical protein
MPKMDVTPEQTLRGGQVICGRNATRLQLNNAMRRAAGLGDNWLPAGPSEKIICLKNQNDLGLINGMFLTLDDIVDEGSLFSATIPTNGNPSGPPRRWRALAHLQGTFEIISPVGSSRSGLKKTSGDKPFAGPSRAQGSARNGERNRLGRWHGQTEQDRGAGSTPSSLRRAGW